MEDNKPEVPVLITAGLVQLKINNAAIAKKLNIADLENRALVFVKNRDNLKNAADFFKDTKALRDIATDIHKTTKQPYLDGGRNCDAGKKLVFDQLDRIEGMIKPWYDNELDTIATEKRDADKKAAQDVAIKKGIEDNVIVFSNRIVAAITKKQLQDIENAINAQKHPQMAKKYGEFHQMAVERYDTVLIPIIKDQKRKIEELDALNAKLLEAEAHNDPEAVDALNEKVNAVSNEILQNHAVVEEAALNQDFFPVVEAVEVLPEFKDKRTNYSYEIEDLEVALRKSRDLLEFYIDTKAAKLIKDKLVKEGAFEGKDVVVKDGIKYIATRVREAL